MSEQIYWSNREFAVLRRSLQIIVVLLALVYQPPQGLAAPGVEKIFEKPVSEKTWGGRLADAVGFGGFSKSYALVIGISNYDSGYADLPTGNDAKRMADYLFNEAGFDHVHLLTEDKVTKQRVAELMSDEFPELLDGNDRFFFYWSGHGDTRSVASGDGKAGYLPLGDTPSRRWSRMIAMRDVREWNRFLPAKQSLFLLDACFSGLAGFVQQSPTPRDWKIEQLSQDSHHVMSAGTENEKTIASDRWGGSLFTTAVLDGLRGAADAASGFEKDDIISLTELKAYVQERVLFERRTIGYQNQITPQVRDLRHNTGEFFFLSSRAVDVARVDPPATEGDRSFTEQSGETDRAAQQQLTPEQVESSLNLDKAAVQRSLSVLGYNPGPADGIFGPRSRVNIRSWQSANGFDSTSYLTAEQYQRLLRDAEQRLAQAPVVREPPASDSSQSSNPLLAFPPTNLSPAFATATIARTWWSSRRGPSSWARARPTADSYDDERPRHRVNLESFAIGKYEVTFDEWDACVAAGGCEHRPEDQGWGRGSRPVINVSWEDAKQYVGWLSRETGETYRLPSEAEWEYAARAFPTSKGSNAPAYAFGNTITQEQANFGGNVGRTAEVGSYPANAWDLYDMHGNVWEWVEDSWHANYDGAPTDGRAWVAGNKSARVLRGGSWSDGPRILRSANRYWARARLPVRRLRLPCCQDAYPLNLYLFTSGFPKGQRPFGRDFGFFGKLDD